MVAAEVLVVAAVAAEEVAAEMVGLVLYCVYAAARDAVRDAAIREAARVDPEVPHTGNVARPGHR